MPSRIPLLTVFAGFLLASSGQAQEFTLAIASFQKVSSFSKVGSLSANGTLAGGFDGSVSPIVGNILTGTAHRSTAAFEEATVANSGGFSTETTFRVAPDFASREDISFHPTAINWDATVMVGKDSSENIKLQRINPVTGRPFNAENLNPVVKSIPLKGNPRGCSASGQVVVGATSTSQAFIARRPGSKDAAGNLVTALIVETPASGQFALTSYAAVTADDFAAVAVGEGMISSTSNVLPIVTRGGVTTAFTPPSSLQNGRALCVSTVGQLVGGTAFNSSPAAGFAFIAFPDRNNLALDAKTFLQARGVNIPDGTRLVAVHDIAITRQTITFGGEARDAAGLPFGWVATIANSDGFFSDEVIGNFWRATDAFARAFPSDGTRSFGDEAEGYLYAAFFTYFNDKVQGVSERDALRTMNINLSFFGFLFFFARGDEPGAFAAFNHFQALASQ